MAPSPTASSPSACCRACRCRASRSAGQGSTINYGAKSLRFLAPVPAGCKLHARSRIAGAEAKPKGTLVTSDIEVAVVGVEKPSLLYGMQLMYTAPRG